MTLKYTKGQHLFFINKPMSLGDLTDTEGVVEHSFIGEDGEERVVVKDLDHPGKFDYRCLHIEQTGSRRHGTTIGQDKLKDPKEVFKIAVAAGIYNEDGTLTPNYGGEYRLFGGVKYYDDDDIQ